ncbi:MAG TPA: hypothetical protein VFD27_06435 [Chthoniobacteraceae bacterium]|jgi:hypothetical protein|nr:hypothetical protein [Chthoniobacteraceae bacterium]
MPDAFAVFDLPCGPWLNVELLKTEFHRRCAAEHPDAGGETPQFAALNAAYRTLRDPVTRLRHLLELENPEALARAAQVPPALADEFMRLAAVRQAAEATLVKWRAAQSLLVRAALAGELAREQRRIDDALGGMAAAQERALARLRNLNAGWRDHLEELAALHAELSYMNKWIGQLRETRLQFDLARG